MLQACLNGARRPEDHPALPVTPPRLADDAVAVRAAGAGGVHLHPKDAAGADMLADAELAAALTAVRARAPGLPVGVTTGAWAVPDPAARVAAVRSWTALPDTASVNWHEDGAEEVAAALLDRGVGVEAGLWHADAVRAWRASPLRDRCCRVLVELPDGPDAAGTEELAAKLLVTIGAGPDGWTRDGVPVQLHGEGSSTWPALRCALRWGLGARIGLEDTLALPDGSPAPGNAALVLAARSLGAR
ncbi:3-keto-5-aminohexanoate cleavage protein [Geodermatophilus sp. URMC 63]